MALMALRSSNIHDIHSAFEKGFWTHTRMNHSVQVGDKVLIFANKGVCRKEGVDWKNQKVLVGTLEKEPFRLQREDDSWPSNVTGTDLQYLVRYNLKHLVLVPFSHHQSVMESIDQDISQIYSVGKMFE